MKVKGESEKAGLKLNIQKTKIMASSPITSWQTDGEKNENSDRLYFLGLHSDFGARGNKICHCFQFFPFLFAMK